MDAHTFGAFVAACRKEQHMTQANLAAKIHVTDKAVSRWERGVGFPDIQTLEPLADALEITVLELIRSERIAAKQVTSEEADKLITNTLHVAASQRKQERKHIMFVLCLTIVLVALILFLDSFQWSADAILFFSVGVAFPLCCICGGLLLFGAGLWRTLHGQPCRQTVTMAVAFLLFLLLFFSLFFFIGALGIGPVPN